jgi:sarcosine oxidase subunit alpha
VRAKQVIIAAGAIERPLVFANNDRPGVMLAASVSSYINRYAVLPGSRAVLFTNNDGAYQTALDLSDAGVAVAAVVDVRPQTNGTLPSQVRAKGIEIFAGSVVVNVKGRRRVQGVQIMALATGGETVHGSGRSLPCDLLAVSGGWSPAVHLHAQSGGKPYFDETKACFVPGRSVQPERSVGAANGAFSLGECLTEGFSAGTQAARAAGFGDGSVATLPTTPSLTEAPLQPLWLVPSPERKGRIPKQFVDLQNDVAAADIKLAAR